MDKNAEYVARSYAKKWLLLHARPSDIQTLIETAQESGVDAELTMLQDVLAQLIGTPAE